MYQLETAERIIVSLAAFLIGISKTGITGAGILAIPLMAVVLPARASTGVVLPMLIAADVFAVAWYRKKASWNHLFRVIPWALAGIVIGYLVMGRLTDRQLQPFIGLVILAMLGMNRWRNRGGAAAPIPESRWFSAFIGLAAGITTMLANAAGPIMVIYLLSMRLPKIQFIGTAAWYFFILNWVKVPFSTSLGLINSESLRLNLQLLPFIVIGAAGGILVLKHIPQKFFSVAVEILAAAAALRLLF